MKKKRRNSTIPHPRAGGEWTEARYWTFLRSLLRGGTRRWAPIRHTLVAARRPYHGPNKRRKWEYCCAACQQWHAGDDVSVDHIVPAGSLRSHDDLPGFVSRLFVEQDGLQVLCTPCHDVKSLADGTVDQRFIAKG